MLIDIELRDYVEFLLSVLNGVRECWAVETDQHRQSEC